LYTESAPKESRMTITLDRLAEALQTLFTTDADQAAKESGMIRRQRKLTGAAFVQAVVFHWLDNPQATIEEVIEDLDLSEQAFNERLDHRGVDCLRRVLEKALEHLFAARPEAIPLLRRFAAVAVEDVTIVGLPAELAGRFPGCGGSDPEGGRAGWKRMTRWDVTTGKLEILPPAAARQSERTLAGEMAPLPPKSLRLCDLGFFDPARLAADSAAGIHFVSRAPALLNVRVGDQAAVNLTTWLDRQAADRIDTEVVLGTKDRLPCRLIALRLPEDVAEKRLKRLRKKLRKKGRKLSERQRVMCQWTVLITDLATEAFTIEEISVLYRVRWQVELLYKGWKSGGGLGHSRGRRGGRVLCEAYAKLLAMVVQHWGTLLRGGPLCGISSVKAARRVKRLALRIAAALGDPMRLRGILKALQARLRRLPRRGRRKKQPSTRELLFMPRLAATLT
jgi:Transposase DDE domain